MGQGIYVYGKVPYGYTSHLNNVQLGGEGRGPLFQGKISAQNLAFLLLISPDIKILFLFFLFSFRFLFFFLFCVTTL